MVFMKIVSGRQCTLHERTRCVFVSFPSRLDYRIIRVFSMEAVLSVDGSGNPRLQE